MPPRPIINDALWRCLCPRYSQIISGSQSTARSATPHNAPIAKARSSQSRANVTTTAPTVAEWYDGQFNRAADKLLERATERLERSRRKKTSFIELSTPELYEHLRYHGTAGHNHEVMKITRILVKDRGHKPNVTMYQAILHSFTSCSEGTAGKIGKVFAEMEEAGVELDARGAECVLEAVAVHPDHLLRTDVLEYMRERWFSLSQRGHNFVVAGLLRDRQFEFALEKLDEMLKNDIQVEGWLWDKTIWMLLEYGEVEEAFQVLKMRQGVEGPGVKLTNALWMQLLDNAAQKHLMEAISMIWNSQVIPGYLKPPTGTCLNILSGAARSGNVKLATDIFRLLTERGITLTSHQYESLMESYLANDDLYAALSVTIYMHESLLKISPDAFHPLFAHLAKDPARPKEAFTLLQGLHDREQKTIPPHAINTCIQAAIHHERLADAFDFYKAYHTVCADTPRTHTFNHLLRGCYLHARKELAMFLVREMIERNVQPDRLTYDRLILTCVQAEELDDALLYYEEMKAGGFEMRRGTHELLIKRCAAAGNAAAVALVREYGKRADCDGRRWAFLESYVHKEFESGVAEQVEGLGWQGVLGKGDETADETRVGEVEDKERVRTGSEGDG